MIHGDSEFVTICGVDVPAGFSVECRWVTDRLAIGGMIGTSANLGRLRDLGISHIVDLQAEFDDSCIGGRLGLEVMWVPLRDDLGNMTAEELVGVVSWVRDALHVDGAKVFIHCLAGQRRAPSIAYAVLRDLGWAEHDALSGVCAAQPKAVISDEMRALVEGNLTQCDRG